MSAPHQGGAAGGAVMNNAAANTNMNAWGNSNNSWGGQQGTTANSNWNTAGQQQGANNYAGLGQQGASNCGNNMNTNNNNAWNNQHHGEWNTTQGGGVNNANNGWNNQGGNTWNNYQQGGAAAAGGGHQNQWQQQGGGNAWNANRPSGGHSGGVNSQTRHSGNSGNGNQNHARETKTVSGLSGGATVIRDKDGKAVATLPPKFATGKSAKFTDVPCLAVFLLIWLCVVGMGVYFLMKVASGDVGEMLDEWDAKATHPAPSKTHNLPQDSFLSQIGPPPTFFYILLILSVVPPFLFGRLLQKLENFIFVF
eukprot:gene318-384_t